MRKFKTESKKLLDLMVNSIYTDHDIFLRELVSNASDSLDKLYLTSLKEGDSSVTRGELAIDISVDKDARAITITDNGIGMTKDELEKNLGTIAHSGTSEFKDATSDSATGDSEKDGSDDAPTDADIIGQFGVGFYSAFMVADKVVVESLAYGSDEPARWESNGLEGYTISDGSRKERGTDITLYLREDAKQTSAATTTGSTATDDDDVPDETTNYSSYLSEYTIRRLVTHYSDYIRYPIRMDVTKSRQLPKPDDAGDDWTPEYESYTENETLNSMVPIWTKKKSEVTDEEYAEFYKAHFNDGNDPLKVISMHAEGALSYDVLLFIPKEPPYDMYNSNFQRGLALYSSGVLIQDKCEDLLPEAFGFVRGVVDSPDLSLNISRELLQHDRQLRAIERKIEKKVAGELERMCRDERETYAEFFKKFGRSMKYSIYATFGQTKELLEDLLVFPTAKSDGQVKTLREYADEMPEGQSELYFAYGDSAERLAAGPGVRAVVNKGYDVIIAAEDVDEFCFTVIGVYDDKRLRNVDDEGLELATEEEQAAADKVAEENAELFKAMCEALDGKVENVLPSSKLTDEACCLTASGMTSIGMLKYFESLPAQATRDGDAAPKAELTLEVNPSHAVFEALAAAQEAGETDKVRDYSLILYNQARLAEGLKVDGADEFNRAVLALMG